jgi:hypothetical protein
MLLEQRADQGLGGAAGVDAVGVGGQIALKGVLAPGDRAGIHRLLYLAEVALEEVGVVAKRQELLGILDRALTEQVGRDILHRPAGDDGDRALGGLRARSQHGDDLVDVHAGGQRIAAVLDLGSQPLKLDDVLEDALVADQLFLVEVVADGGDRGALFDDELAHHGVARVHGHEELAVYKLPAAGHDAQHHDQAAQKHQHRSEEMP